MLQACNFFGRPMSWPDISHVKYACFVRHRCITKGTAGYKTSRGKPSLPTHSPKVLDRWILISTGKIHIWIKQGGLIVVLKNCLLSAVFFLCSNESAHQVLEFPARNGHLIFPQIHSECIGTNNCLNSIFGSLKVFLCLQTVFPANYRPLLYYNCLAIKAVCRRKQPLQCIQIAIYKRTDIYKCFLLSPCCTFPFLRRIHWSWVGYNIWGGREGKG